MFVEAVQLVRKADNTYDSRESVRLLRNANQLLKKIVSSYPQSAIAVQLSTNQLIGDFDVSEFEARIRALSCEPGNYVEGFLAEYGITAATGPLTEACFLYRMESLLDPPEQPLMAARTDWLSVAVGYGLTGQPERARAIILPFLGLLRKNGPGDAQDSYPALARALALTGANDLAQQVTDRVSDCTARLTTMLHELKSAQMRNDDAAARNMADAIREYADANQCDWQKGIAVQAYSLTGQEKEAKALFDRLTGLPNDGAGTNGNTPPELVIAASMGAEPEVALQMARGLSDKEANAMLSVVRNLAARGELQAAHDLTIEIKDTTRRALALAALVNGAMQKNDEKQASAYMSELANMRSNAVQSTEQAGILTAIARAEKARYKDDRWRGTIQAALNALERVEEGSKSALITNLAAAVVFIKTGKGALD